MNRRELFCFLAAGVIAPSVIVNTRPTLTAAKIRQALRMLNDAPFPIEDDSYPHYSALYLVDDEGIYDVSESGWFEAEA